MHVQSTALAWSATGRRIVAADELPAYPDEAVESIERALSALPRDLIWLTYGDIRAYFGISRATVARRLKRGLVPGVAMEAGRVVEDAPVRRFDRDQLRWILLAVRYAKRSSSALAH